jgi:hypothetical protein
VPTFPDGVTPESELLAVERGRTFRCTFFLFKDKAKTEPLNLAGLTITLSIDGVLTLASGSGLTINAAAGSIAVKITPAQSKAVVLDQTHWALTLEENPEEIVTGRNGTMIFSNP